MERAPEKLPNTSSRLIAMAALLVGAEEVMNEMGCAAQDFQAYRCGQKEPTWLEFDRLTALIVREQGKLIAQIRESMAKAREDRRPKG